MKVFRNWESWLFRFFGTIALALSLIWLIRDAPVAKVTASFVIGLLCFVFANLSKFKRFKGLGFEAELWEDKQKEAEELIGKLNGIVSLYSSEVLSTKFKSGRWSDNESRWHEVLKLYKALKSNHASAGQDINLTSAERDMGTFFSI
ncbi:MAG: hypothetical protein GJ676_13010 [Rhodobacteraceae bacterium]|nr:hypothetical protein [Paracoccaceae bacterium]